MNIIKRILFNRCVLVTLSGGAGNQLFMYAASKAYALETKATLIMDCTTGFVSDKCYKRLPVIQKLMTDRKSIIANGTNAYIVRIFSQVLCLMNKIYKGNYVIQQNGFEANPQLLRRGHERISVIKGYWQSELYFMKWSDEIRRTIRLDEKFKSTRYKEIEEMLKSDIWVALHVRYFGRGKNKNAYPDEKGYYKNAIRYHRERNPNCKFMVCSNNSEHCREILGDLIDKNCYLLEELGESLSDIEELILMSKCRGIIVAHSTFSWWSAWLMDGCGEEVTVPGHINCMFEAAWGFDGLIPERWVKL